MKKIIILIISIIAIITIIALSLFIFPKYIFKEEPPVIIVNLKENLTVEFNTSKKVSDFIEEINGTINDDYIIDSKEVGEQEIEFSYINDDNKKVDYKFNIEIIDTVPPIIWIGNSYTITKNGDKDFYKDILCGDNYDNNPNCYIEGEYDTSIVGTYPLVFKAVDNSGNETIKEFNLSVVEPKKVISSTPTYTYFEDIIAEHKTDNTKIGLDISSWQDEVDFETIKKAGVEFVILKIGGTRKATGEYYLDSQFKRNIEEANKYGIEVGIYFFSYAKTKEEAINDAKWVINELKDYSISLPIAFDWEDWSNFNNYNLSFYNLTDIADSFLKEVESAGYKGMLYSSKSYLEEIWLPIEFPTWLAHYTKKTNYQKDYILWQLCNNGIIDGINGYVDINIMYN